MVRFTRTQGKRPGSYDFRGKRRSRAGQEEAAARGAYKAAVFVHSPNVRFEHCCVAGSLSVAAMPRLIAEFTSRAPRQLLGHRTSVPRASVRGHVSCALCIALPSIPERNLRSMPMTWHEFACATVHYIQTHLSCALYTAAEIRLRPNGFRRLALLVVRLHALATRLQMLSLGRSLSEHASDP